MKSKNPPWMATLTYRHSGNSGRNHHLVRYTIVHKKAMTRAFLPSFLVCNYGT